ncbi:MAG: hypothetical protein QNJ70_24035 [Xenococcaceae cyanobacterium MO_207.B15]|nr:hypothetical protein [Xenococcaceae cyanobacterium MO_207.B15]
MLNGLISGSPTAIAISNFSYGKILRHFGIQVIPVNALPGCGEGYDSIFLMEGFGSCFDILHG